MRIMNLRKKLAKSLGAVARAGRVAASVTIIAGGLAFAGQANADELLTNGSFEDASPTGWNDGAGVDNDLGFGTYNHVGQAYYSGAAPAASGDVYGWRWGNENGSGSLGSATQVVNVQGGTAYSLSAWLSSWTGDTDYAVVSVEWYDGLNGAGSSLGSTVFDGNDQASVYIVGSADAGGLADAGEAATQDNWTLYSDAGTSPATALSAAVVIAGASVSNNGNDAYVDLVSLDTTPGIPEPGSLALLGLGAALVGCGRRKRT